MLTRLFLLCCIERFEQQLALVCDSPSLEFGDTMFATRSATTTTVSTMWEVVVAAACDCDNPQHATLKLRVDRVRDAGDEDIDLEEVEQPTDQDLSTLDYPVCDGCGQMMQIQSTDLDHIDYWTTKARRLDVFVPVPTAATPPHRVPVVASSTPEKVSKK